MSELQEYHESEELDANTLGDWLRELYSNEEPRVGMPRAGLGHHVLATMLYVNRQFIIKRCDALTTLAYLDEDPQRRYASLAAIGTLATQRREAEVIVRSTESSLDPLLVEYTVPNANKKSLAEIFYEENIREARELVADYIEPIYDMAVREAEEAGVVYCPGLKAIDGELSDSIHRSA